MKHKLKNPPKFYAFYHEYNGDKLKPYNIITQGLIEDLDKAVFKKYYNLDTSKYDILDTREKFINKLKHELMYRYWSKCEWEFVCTNWSGKEFEQKVDVFSQLEPNIEVIADLIINAMQIDFKKKKKDDTLLQHCIKNFKKCAVGKLIYAVKKQKSHK